MPLDEEIAEINRLLFYQEFTFSQTQFEPDNPQNGETEVELADSVIWLATELIAFQLKERALGDDHTVGTEKKWFERKVLRLGIKQIKDTLSYLDRHEVIRLENHRGHVRELRPLRLNQVHKLVVFKAHELLPEDCKLKKFHKSETAGLIHLIPEEDYKNIVLSHRTRRSWIKR